MTEARMYKRSQRPTWSCTECSRRKIKCDKKIPCEPCVKRNTAHLCSLDHEATFVQPSFASPQRDVKPTAHAQQTPQSSYFAVQQFSGSPTSSSQCGGGGGGGSGSGSGNDLAYFVHQLSNTVSDLDRRLQAVEGYGAAVPTANAHPHQPPTRASPTRSSYDTSPPSASSSRILHSSPSTHRYTQQSRSSVAETALTFEYLALGRDRHRGILQPDSDKNGQPLPTTDNILAHPLHEPLSDRIQSALLPSKALEYVLTFSKDVIAWQHACMHIPTFQRECDAFASLQPHERWLWTDPLWLALFFVVQSIAVHQMPPGDVEHIIGTSTRPVPEVLLEAAVKCLDAGRYLSEPSLYTCQALAILCVTGHNVADSNLLSSYLAIGIKTAQMLNLHHLAGEAARVEARLHEAGGELLDGSPEWRSRIVRLEVGKRIWWSLVQQDYLALPFCGTSMVNPRQHDTPLPANVHDDELDRGHLRLHYEESDLTLVQKLRLTARMAQIVYSFFEHLSHRHPSPPRLDDDVQPFESQLLALLPSTQPRSTNPTLRFGLALRRYINIGVSHKILVLHRAFCSVPATPTAQQLQASQARCLDAARQILEQVRGIKPSGRPEGQVGAMWTVSYQAVAAAMVVALSYFRGTNGHANGKSSNSAVVVRQEVLDARDVLHTLAYRSTIAQRGVELMDDLMHGFDEADRQGQSHRLDDAAAATAAVSNAPLNGTSNGAVISVNKRARNDEDDHHVGDSNKSSSVQAAPPPHGSIVPDFDGWDVASVLQSMPDVSKLFDGSMGSTFGTF